MCNFYALESWLEKSCDDAITIWAFKADAQQQIMVTYGMDQFNE